MALRDSVSKIVNPKFDLVFVHQDVASHEQRSTGVVYESVDATQSPLHDELRDEPVTQGDYEGVLPGIPHAGGAGTCLLLKRRGWRIAAQDGFLFRFFSFVFGPISLKHTSHLRIDFLWRIVRYCTFDNS